MSIRSFREWVNLRLYNSKTNVLRGFRGIIFFVSITSLISLVYFYGFPQTDYSRALLINVVKFSFAFYILNFFVKFLYTFEPKVFLKENWFEAGLMLFLVIEGVSDNLFDFLILTKLGISLGIHNMAHYTTLFIQFYFLIVILLQITRSSGNILPNIKVHPSNVFIFSFLLIIFGGTAMLMLPEMTTIQGSMNFLDALFTSTSASCVTGLIVEDTATFFTFKGQLVILILMKLGGLNIIAFGSFIALASKFGLGVKQHSVIEDFVNKDSVMSAKGMLGRVIIWSFAIEFIGSLLLYLSWGDNIPFKTVGDKLFVSIFHSFSAFNNAGLSLFTDGFYNGYVRDNYLVHNIITLLVFLGALGFMTIFDVFGIRKIRNRIKHPWKQLEFSSKISLYFSLGLIAFGALFYFFLESGNTLQDQSFFGQITTSVFQSATRTSGFNTVDIGSIGAPMLVLLLFLMFVGSSSSSTGGGIKTSTFALLMASAIATIKGKKHTELFKRSISNDLIFRAFSVFMFFVVGNLICIFLLSITETHILLQEGRSILDLIFEEVSAFSTVGLSTGITNELSYAGRVIVIISMFIGRVGTLTVAFALGKQSISTNYKYPEAHTMVG
jgi:trk system potassium uptake protein TrkH